MVVLGQASDPTAAMRLAANLAPDLVLVDLSMDDADWIAALGEIVTCRPQVKIIVISAFSNEDEISSLVQVGVLGYLAKTTVQTRWCTRSIS